uniref:U3 small nucleolar RNA-associated protein 15 homolog n=1 Tax=Glossina brevipalpis TaxID=37001 RepID=A0A1A9WMA4_9MUSC
MSSFKTLNVRKYPKAGKIVTPDTEYWKKLSVPTLVKEFGAIDFVDFNPIEPHYFAVTCSVRVQIYNPITKLVVKNLSRFQETAYGGTFRQDGRLLVAGDEQGLVKLFDTSSKNVLRLFKGHKAPVHRVNFTADLLHIASFSDDKTVKLWDITSEKTLHTFTDHNDYVRAGAVNPVSTDVIVSGGYDGKIQVYDTRTQQATLNVDHGCPVESLLFLPTGGIFLSAGGTEVRVWDVFAGCRLLAKLSQHHKTVTCLRLGSNGKRILSGGLDRHIKIYDVASYEAVHTLDFSNSILSMGVAPNDQTVVAGMVDGLISIQNMESCRENERQQQQTRRKRVFSAFSDRADLPVDHQIVIQKHRILNNYDRLLRRYEYTKCLTSVLNPAVSKCHPEITVSVMQELIHRKGLHRALAGRSQNSLNSIIYFINRHLGEHRFMRVLIDAATILLDVYDDKFNEFTGQLIQKFLNLSDTLKRETALTYNLLELQGALELLVAASDVSNNDDEMVHFIREGNDRTNIKQSAMAKEGSILTV